MTPRSIPPTPGATTLAQAATESLADWDAAQRRRQRRIVQPVAGGGGVWLDLDGQRLLGFGSNDYLGLAHHPAVIEAACAATRQHGAGATASALVCGHGPAHEALEQALAAHTGLPRALFFHSGYAANTGTVPALVGTGDAVFSDALNHACLIDGARLSRADIHVVPHRDLDALDAALSASPARRKLITTDTVFSMDGSLADVPGLLALCERHDAWLLVDDAHGFGVLGPHGEGALAHFGLSGQGRPASPAVLQRLVYMATLGKAAGVAGAFVAGAPELIDWLMQRARTYMFATAPPPGQAAAAGAALGVMVSEPQRRAHLQDLVARLRTGIHAAQAAGHLPAHWRLLDSDSAIQPLVVGRNAEALSLMQRLQAQGIWVPAIRPPTVPEGTARLRISLSAAHAAAHVDRLVQALAQCAPVGGPLDG